MPRVSVISCVYNLEDMVLETVDSVLNQTYDDFEFVMVDDGSTDRTVERLQTVHDPRFKLVQAQHSGLPAVGRNRAVAAAALGEFIAIVDADDVCFPERLERQVAFFDDNSNAGMVHTKVQHFVDDRRVIMPDRHVRAGVTPAEEVLERLIGENFICTPSTMFRTDALDLSGYFHNPDPRICGTEDFDHWLRLSEAGVAFGYIDDALLKYRVRPDSVSRNRPRNLFANLVVLSAAVQRRPDLYAAHQQRVDRRFGYLYRELAGCKIRRGMAGAWSDLWKSMRHRPFDWRTWAWYALGLLGSNGSNLALSSWSRIRPQPEPAPEGVEIEEFCTEPEREFTR